MLKGRPSIAGCSMKNGGGDLIPIPQVSPTTGASTGIHRRGAVNGDAQGSGEACGVDVREKSVLTRYDQVPSCVVRMIGSHNGHTASIGLKRQYSKSIKFCWTGEYFVGFPYLIICLSGKVNGRYY